MRFKHIIIIIFSVAAACVYAQGPYSFTITSTIDECTRGTVKLRISPVSTDTVNIRWSNGASDTTALYEVDGGDYSVHINIRHRKDTIIHEHDTTLILVKDTTLAFTVLKSECVVRVAKYFSPNGDAYNDLLIVENADHYPDFEFDIFNRWGQRVYHQAKTYVPWDGKSLGIDLADGAYFYVFFYDASKRHHFVKGDITILR